MSGRPRVDPLTVSPPQRRFRTSPTLSSAPGWRASGPRLPSPRRFRTSPMLSSARGWRALGPCLASPLTAAHGSPRRRLRASPTFSSAPGWRTSGPHLASPLSTAPSSRGYCSFLPGIPLLLPGDTAPSSRGLHARRRCALVCGRAALIPAPALACGPALLGPCGASSRTLGLCPWLNSGGACVVIDIIHPRNYGLGVLFRADTYVNCTYCVPSFLVFPGLKLITCVFLMLNKANLVPSGQLK